MSAEELLKMLRDGGMDDEGIKALLGDALASLEGPAEEPTPEEVEKAEDEDAKAAGELLGVEL